MRLRCAIKARRMCQPPPSPPHSAPWTATTGPKEPSKGINMSTHRRTAGELAHLDFLEEIAEKHRDH